MNWFGLNWTDILINTLAFSVIPGVMAAYGGHLAAETVPEGKRRLRIQLTFWLLFAVGVIATGWQQARAAEADLLKDTNDTWQAALIGKLLYMPPPPPPLIVQSNTIAPKPDIGMEFVNPEDVAFRIANLSKESVLRDPKYGFALIDLDAPLNQDSQGHPVPQFLAIPARVDAGDFLRPSQKFLPRAIVSSFPSVQAIVKPKDRIFGWALVSCPDCIKDRNYLIFFVNGSGGWYTELPKSINVPMGPLLADSDGTLSKLVPLSRRIPIVNQ